MGVNMDEMTTVVSAIALMLGAGWASGINLYAAILAIGIMGNTGVMVLPEDLALVGHPLVLVAAGFMYCVEFFADKIPGVDNGWDALHTFIRVPAGAVLASAAVGDVSEPIALAAALVGGGLALTSHTTKAGSRVMVNTSPEPFSNIGLSLMEDAVVFFGIWTAFNHPYLFIGLLILFLIFAAWLLPKIWRGIKRVLSLLTRPFQSKDPVSDISDP
jgi:uncharacterized protein DUF4126